MLRRLRKFVRKFLYIQRMRREYGNVVSYGFSRKDDIHVRSAWDSARVAWRYASRYFEQGES